MIFDGSESTILSLRFCHVTLSDEGSLIVLIFGSLALFLFSYRKQTEYVIRRVEKALDDRG